MTDPHTDPDDAAQHSDGASAGAPRTTRRTFVRSAAAGAGALALGSSTYAGSASAEPQIPTPQLETDGNVLVDPDGNTVTLRGINMIDPRRADVLANHRGRDAVGMVDLLTGPGWDTQVIRVPLQPSDIAEAPTGYSNGPITPVAFTRDQLQTYLEDHVDPVVDRCEERGVYVILDYHRHWTGDSAQNNNTEFDGYWGEATGETVEINETLQEEVVMFWDVVAQHYGNRDHCLFEVYNEPTEPGMWGDPRADGDENWAITWAGFVNFVQPMMDQIAEHTDNVQLLGSPSWTQSPEGILVEPEDLPDWADIEFDGVDEPEHLAMTYHIYPGHNVSRNQNWDQPATEGAGTASLDTPVYEEYPLVVTEFGWDNSLNSQYLAGTTSDFGEPFVEGFMESGIAEDAISWTAWCGDIWWDPTMFDPAFEQTDVEIGDPYSADVPNDCPDLPCEWELTSGDDRMGQYIKDKLTEYADHNNPGGEVGGNAPPAPSDVSVVSTTESSIQVSWSDVADATSYVVSVDGSQRDTTTDTSYEVTGLSASTSYTIGVASRNADGTSTATTVTATTDDGGGTDGCTDDAVNAAEVDSEWVCDLNGDELYRDVNADGTLGQDDVVYFFENQHRSAWDQPGLFDFSENGSVGHGDVVALFEDVVVG